MARLRSFLVGAVRLQAQELYIALVGQARNPFFYAECRVPDTLDGRFEILLLHVFLVLYALRSSASPLNAASPRFARPPDVSMEDQSRLLLECLFDDMDRNLREMGVGDMGVGKRVKTMSKAAFGRFEVYTQAYGDDEALREALRRNVYRGADVPDEALAALMRYIRTYRLP